MRITGATLDDVKFCANKAGKAILEVYASEDFQVEEKSDNSPLTIADRQSNDLICSFLKSEFPDIPIISEENKHVPFEIRKDYEYCWMVDPLDGTKEFISRNGEFTVNIALIFNGIPVLGVVQVPATDSIYWAAAGSGAWKQSGAGAPEALVCNTFRRSDRGLRIVCSRSHLNPATKDFIEDLNEPELTSKGSSLKFMVLAEGEAELYPRIAPTMEWDTAAAQCILEEAGGSVVDYESGDRLRYNKESLRNPSFIAIGREVDQ